jgi:hypothetical protein
MSQPQIGIAVGGNPRRRIAPDEPGAGPGPGR